MDVGRLSLSRRGVLKAGAAGAVLGAAGLTGRVLTTGAVDQISAPAGSSPNRREYWIQVDSFPHNVVPTGRDLMGGMTFTPADSTLWALGYRAWTPGWEQPLPAGADIGPNTGIPGPVIRAEVGQQVVIHLRNNDTHYGWPHSMHPHGFRYDLDSCGTYLSSTPDQPGAAVQPGQSYTYTGTALPSSVGTWPYHDHAAAQGLTDAGPVMELNAELGMFGLIAVTDHHTARVDREHFLFFHDLYQDDVPSLTQDFDCFNGLSYLGNTPTFTAKAGDRVRWRIAALGKEFHVFHLHGHRWKSQQSGQWVDSEILGPSTSLTVEYVEDNPGQWIYHCHVVDHMAGGMVGGYHVSA